MSGRDNALSVNYQSVQPLSSAGFRPRFQGVITGSRARAWKDRSQKRPGRKLQTRECLCRDKKKNSRQTALHRQIRVISCSDIFVGVEKTTRSSSADVYYTIVAFLARILENKFSIFVYLARFIVEIKTYDFEIDLKLRVLNMRMCQYAKLSHY